MSDAAPMHTPFDEALSQLISQIDVAAYNTTRNHLSGAVTRLSPYITHGYASLPEVVSRIKAHTPLTPNDKLYFEFAWREFYQHVWHHVGEGVLQDLRPALPGIHYAPALPEDIRTGATGLAVIDQAVRTLYATGYLHNHARMWLASYLIHFRKVHWRAGADWLYGHLLDGDLASNHLSWQWVAGTFSVKPYLFNADNVAKFAPPEWHVGGSALDDSYEALERIARSQRVMEPAGGEPIEAPPLMAAPEGLAIDTLRASGDVALIHPWALASTPRAMPRVGVIHAPFHAQFKWSARRWAFVLTRMSQLCDTVVTGDLASLPALKAHTLATLNPGYQEALAKYSPQDPPRLIAWPDKMSRSFSQFWQSRGENNPALWQG